jgi:hypothetical protein
VDEASHDDHGSQIDLEGYRTCRNEWCGALVLTEITYRTAGLCGDCFRSRLGKAITEVEIMNRGQRTSLRTRTKPWPSKNKGNRDTAKRAERAKLRAMKRLRAVFPDLYDVFYAEERARAGLDPWPVDMAVRQGPDPDAEATMEFTRVYHALHDHGVDVDGLANEPSSTDD